MEMSGSSQMRISSSCPEFKLTSTLLYVQVNYFRVARNPTGMVELRLSARRNVIFPLFQITLAIPIVQHGNQLSPAKSFP
jgi:hypothetical protein